ncbi:MAG TPA: hypothetical protein VEK07_16790 [Polyangiaceae bacterium]|nr:hypothetical protein [Polyangiaceae bacterium]
MQELPSPFVSTAGPASTPTGQLVPALASDPAVIGLPSKVVDAADIEPPSERAKTDSPATAPPQPDATRVQASTRGASTAGGSWPERSGMQLEPIRRP